MGRIISAIFFTAVCIYGLKKYNPPMTIWILVGIVLLINNIMAILRAIFD